MGVFLGSSVPSSATADQAEYSKSEKRTDLTRLQEEHGTLKAQLEKLRSANADLSKGGAGGSGALEAVASKKKWELLVELSKQKLLAPQLNFVDSAGALNPAVASVFDLTSHEQESITHSIYYAREKMAELEKINATVTRTPDGKVVIEVKPFPGKGGAVYDELIKNIGQTLGSERNAAFQTLGGEQMEKAFGAFGAAERKLTVTSQPESKSSRYLASDERIAPGSRSNNSSNYKTKDELVRKVGTITNLLPPNF